MFAAKLDAVKAFDKMLREALYNKMKSLLPIELFELLQTKLSSWALPRST